MGSVWTAMIGLLVVPFYLRYMGMEAYGLVGFFATMQALFQVLDLGLAPTLNREVARGSALGDLAPARNLVHTLSVVYWGTSMTIAAVAILAGPVIAQHWLNANRLPTATVSHAVMLMGLIIATRWPSGMYLGAVMGAQRLTIASFINASMVTVSNLGAVAVLAFISPRIEAFFLWQALMGFVNVVVLRTVAWRIIGGSETSRFDAEALKRVWRFSAGMGFVALSELVLVQLDKVLLSRFVTLEDLGRYNLAGLATRVLYLFLFPVFSSIYPRLSAMVASEQTASIIDFYKTGTRMLLAVVFPMAAFVAVFSTEIFYLWTRDLAVATSIHWVVTLLLIGTAMNGAMHFPYALQLAYGKSQLPAMINSVLIAVFIPLVIVLSLRYGILGGAAAWAILNTAYLFLGTWLTHRSILQGIATRWMLQDVGIPLALALVFVVAGGTWVHRQGLNTWTALICGAILAAAACGATLISSPHLLERSRRLVMTLSA
jgi:O-antigen/teichoic acid export membrane protein